MNIVFKDDDIRLYEKLIEQAETQGISYQTAVKRMIDYYQRFYKNEDE